MGTSHQHKIVQGRWVVRHLFKRHGLWRGRVRDKVTRRVRELATRERDRRRAEQVLFNWLKELERQADPAAAPAGIRFDQAFEEWLDLKDVRPITLKYYRLTFNGIYAPEFGCQVVSEIGIREIERFLKKVKGARGVSDRTRQKYLTELRSFFRWARRRRYCTEDPTDGVKVSRAAKRVGLALTHVQASGLLRACQTATVHAIKDDRRKQGKQKWVPPPHLFVAVLIALHTGLRRGNITNLQWLHVDLTERKITIAAEEMKANADLVIPIHPEVAEVLSKMLLESGKIDPRAPVLGLKLKEITRSFKSALKKAKLPDMRWHDLRHTAGTWWAERTTEAIRKRLMGHAPKDVTDLYTHLPFETLKGVVDSMPRILQPECEPCKKIAAEA